MNFRFVAFSITLLVVLSNTSVANGQSIVDNDLPIPVSLRHLDKRLSDQRKTQLEGEEAALSPEGQLTALWWQESDRLCPLRLYGTSILEHATSHSGSQEALACLSYILEYGEGEFSELHRSACNELLDHYRDDPELSAICSYCTNPLWYHENERFLTSLRHRSTSPLVQTASTFYLSKLLDNCIVFQRDVARLRDNFKESGCFTAKPEMMNALDNIEALPTSELERMRTELLDLVVEMEGNLRPWGVKRTFGRLNYEFSPEPDGPTFREMANDLKYEISYLRVDAKDLFNNALAEAKRQNKNVILVFGGPSCVPCKMLKEFLALQAEFFDKDYIILHIDSRNENARLLRDQFSDDTSIPFTAIVNSARVILSTSVGDEGNIGFPTSIEGRNHFISMIEKSAIRTNQSDFKKLAREYNNFSELMRGAAK